MTAFGSDADTPGIGPLPLQPGEPSAPPGRRAGVTAALRVWRWPGGAPRLLALLLLADGAFIVLHLMHDAHRLTGVADPAFALPGHAKVFQHVQELWLVALFLGLLRRRFEWLYLAWAALFAYVLADDALHLHEAWGVRLAEGLGLPAVAGLRPRDLGELMVFAGAGAVLLGGVFAAWLRGGPAVRAVGVRLVALFGLLVFCGVVIDAAHAMAQPYKLLRAVLSIAEDGGEMAAMSLLVAYVFGLGREDETPDEHG